MVRRHQHWPTLLAEAIKAKQGKPFAWGSQDCVTMAADLVEVMTGDDLLGDFRGQWMDAASARRMGDVEQLVADTLQARGLQEIGVLFAQRGDLVIADLQHGATAGVVDTTGQRAVFPGEKGLARVPLQGCRRAWRVG